MPPPIENVKKSRYYSTFFVWIMGGPMILLYCDIPLALDIFGKYYASFGVSLVVTPITSYIFNHNKTSLYKLYET